MLAEVLFSMSGDSGITQWFDCTNEGPLLGDSLVIGAVSLFQVFLV